MKLYTKYQSLWFKAIHLTVYDQLKTRVDKLKNRNSRKGVHLQWRIAYNLFYAGDLFGAITIFDTILADESSFLINDSFVHQMAGRCCTKLFLSTESHYHLENAHMHYQNAVDTMVVNLTTMFKLPVLFMELGNVLEFYGAFESAIEVYNRIMTNFPNFRGYFDALYRTAIVSRHLASCMPAGEAR
jgi:tetratricopeptide (TPR) repeat protein